MNYSLYPLQENQLLATNATIGLRLKQRRKELKLTQQSLAQAINISYQQVQKYEKGTNRIGADRLYYLAMLLGVDVSYFFKPISETQGLDKDPIKPLAKKTTKKMVGKLEISEINPAVRIALVNLVDVMNTTPENKI